MPHHQQEPARPLQTLHVYQGPRRLSGGRAWSGGSLGTAANLANFNPDCGLHVVSTPPSTLSNSRYVLQCTNKKAWKDIAAQLGIGPSSSGAYTLKKHYGKNLLPFECHFERGGIDPAPILSQVEAASKKKGKNAQERRAPSPGSQVGLACSQSLIQILVLVQIRNLDLGLIFQHLGVILETEIFRLAENSSIMRTIAVKIRGNQPQFIEILLLVGLIMLSEPTGEHRVIK